jgi:hypothetical protein
MPDAHARATINTQIISLGLIIMLPSFLKSIVED